MFLVIDVGNTNTVVGLFDGDTLVTDWRIRSDKRMTEDEFNILISSLFNERGIKPERIEQTLISCVVPALMNNLEAFCRKYLGHSPRWVDAVSIQGIMPVLYANPSEVGADRIVNAVAAYERYHSALIVIDFGTATTFDVISAKGEYMGGAISPGISISAEALFQRASKLPRVEIFTPPDKVVGTDTPGSIQSGIIFGYAGLVDGMVARIKKEMAFDPKVIATGGLAPLIFNVAESIEEVCNTLTLEGLKIIGNKLMAL